MATLTVYPEAGSGGSNVSVDAYVRRYNTAGETWATIHDSAVATAVVKDAETTLFTEIYSKGSSTDWIGLARSIFTMDTSSLGASATVNSAVFSVIPSSKTDNAGISPDMNVFSSSPADSNDVVAGDYDSLGTTPFSTAKAYADIVIASYNDFTLNASGLAAISLTGITELGLRNENYDADNVEPLHPGGLSNLQSRVLGYFADSTGTTNDPKLVIDYTPGTSLKDPIGGIIPFPR